MTFTMEEIMNLIIALESHISNMRKAGFDLLADDSQALKCKVSNIYGLQLRSEFENYPNVSMIVEGK